MVFEYGDFFDVYVEGEFGVNVWVDVVCFEDVGGECGIDLDVYIGFVFGMGVERIVMFKYCIGDICLLFENDLCFFE